MTVGVLELFHIEKETANPALVRGNDSLNSAMHYCQEDGTALCHGWIHEDGVDGLAALAFKHDSVVFSRYFSGY